MPRVGVVGSGQCGLIVSRLLAEASADTIVIERLPALGGQEPERPLTDSLADAAFGAGVWLKPATLAVSWERGVLAILGIDGAERIELDTLVVATGTRPATPGELGIVGDRCAGVVPASAAIHLTESGVLLGHRPAILGSGALAARLAALLREAGASSVTVIANDAELLNPIDADQFYLGWRLESIHGTGRVNAVVVCRDGTRERVLADAVILAAGRLPMRNIEGAVFPNRGVVFCQSRADPKNIHDANSVARRAVEEALREPAGVAAT